VDYREEIGHGTIPTHALDPKQLSAVVNGCSFIGGTVAPRGFCHILTPRPSKQAMLGPASQRHGVVVDCVGGSNGDAPRTAWDPPLAGTAHRQT
jgi:hypothetical protein